MILSRASTVLFCTICITVVFPSHSFSLQPAFSSPSCSQQRSGYSHLKTSSQGNDVTESNPAVTERNNSPYIKGLLKELSTALDKYIMTGSKTSIGSALNIVAQIEKEAMEEELIDQAKRMIQRVGISIPKGQTNEDENEKNKETPRVGSVISSEPEYIPNTIDTLKMHDKSKKELMKEMNLTHGSGNSNRKETIESEKAEVNPLQTKINEQEAAIRTRALIAKAGSGTAFEGEALGVGGLDHILSQIKRRIWVPLAAPPSLIDDLGINPVRGLLLYGSPGCGKTLLARSLGKIISPSRPITVVSGPEIMDRFVGSSEKNLRAIFDNPPDIYDKYRLGTKDNGEALEKTALHVVILDEFDAIARSRGGSGNDGGSQGDAGVARDSVVNQLLAKMDGVDNLKVPTLLIALTNKRSLIDPALLRPGRFEVQIEVPPPQSLDQRISILKIHMKKMQETGRLLVRDAPPRTSGSVLLEKLEVQGQADNVPSYDELLEYLGMETAGMTGASLAGVVRAAASLALERAVFNMEKSSMTNCVITKSDFRMAIKDVIESASGQYGENYDNSLEETRTSSPSVSPANVKNLLSAGPAAKITNPNFGKMTYEDSTMFEKASFQPTNNNNNSMPARNGMSSSTVNFLSAGPNAQITNPNFGKMTYEDSTMFEKAPHMQPPQSSTGNMLSPETAMPPQTGVNFLSAGPNAQITNPNFGKMTYEDNTMFEKASQPTNMPPNYGTSPAPGNMLSSGSSSKITNPNFGKMNYENENPMFSDYYEPARNPVNWSEGF